MSGGGSNRLPFYRQAALIGTGLIGGSLGIRLRERSLVGKITGYDKDKEALGLALKRGAVDRAVSSPREAASGAELVILAVPVLSIAALVEEVAPVLSPGTTITDVGSTKGLLLESVAPQIPPGVFFIGGHPMAGSEDSGIKGADPALLENAIYVLTPHRGVPAEPVERLCTMLEAAGAQPLLLNPERHDRLTAMVSHLPHLTAAALVECAARWGDEELVRTLAAGGFRDTTRIALGNPEVWRDIFISNRRALLEAIDSLEKVIGELKEALAREDAGALERFLQRSREFRRRVPHRGRGILPELFEVAVLAPDAPGIIGRLAGLLGKAGINIASIEILHVRELEGGSIRLGFREKKLQEGALAVLKENGFRAHLIN